MILNISWQCLCYMSKWCIHVHISSHLSCVSCHLCDFQTYLILRTSQIFPMSIIAVGRCTHQEQRNLWKRWPPNFSWTMFNGCIHIAWYVHVTLSHSQVSSAGCRRPGAYLMPGHQYPSSWGRSVREYQRNHSGFQRSQILWVLIQNI